jgi:hypothetical protein
MANKSSAFDIFEVAWRSKHRRASVSDIPFPLSVIRINDLPESFIKILTKVAPESMAFSTSSLTTDAGR